MNTAVDRYKIDIVMTMVRKELIAALEKWPRTHASPHESHSILREELEELWDHVKADTGQTIEARKEAIQTAAMAARYVLELCDLS